MWTLFRYKISADSMRKSQGMKIWSSSRSQNREKGICFLSIGLINGVMNRIRNIIPS